MNGDDLAYFRRRAQVEIEQAQSASSPKAVAAHHEMANMYLERVDELVKARGLAHA